MYVENVIEKLRELKELWLEELASEVSSRDEFDKQYDSWSQKTYFADCFGADINLIKEDLESNEEFKIFSFKIVDEKLRTQFHTENLVEFMVKNAEKFFYRDYKDKIDKSAKNLVKELVEIGNFMWKYGKMLESENSAIKNLDEMVNRGAFATSYSIHSYDRTIAGLDCKEKEIRDLFKVAFGMMSRHKEDLLFPRHLWRFSGYTLYSSSNLSEFLGLPSLINARIEIQKYIEEISLKCDDSLMIAEQLSRIIFFKENLSVEIPKKAFHYGGFMGFGTKSLPLHHITVKFKQQGVKTFFIQEKDNKIIIGNR